ncbi:hypothetical protein G5B47_09085 [Paenibacillus sp. 7124]|uniref:Uncharacterized protein n=1 Tax=Paenibacillus apii TaxID=1850370 RepID=A0A6M1PH47_9BACL|nr:hypothetical protein [Paenibacillus apii]NGM82570.1 hypothetical protein [Paenibacillus apii]NJJ39712.1 hypothetical protein [Paenibacillus apii]
MDDKRDELRKILDYYNAGTEINRLEKGMRVIKWERSKQIISCHLSEGCMVIYDIGGGADLVLLMGPLTLLKISSTT